MTHGQFNRQRRWEKRVQPAYSDGVQAGVDARLRGAPRPDPLLSDYNTTFYLRSLMRRAQTLTNRSIARSRGRADGWDLADRQLSEENIENEVTTGLREIADYLSGRGRWGMAA